MKGEKETPMLEKSEGDTIQKLFRGRIQNVWGEGHGGEARLSKGGGRGITTHMYRVIIEVELAIYSR